MAEFDPTELRNPSRQRFLRLRTGIYVSHPYHIDAKVPVYPNHEALAIEHGIRNLIEEAIRFDADSIDGGYITLRNQHLLISEISKGFGIPIPGSKARQITAAQVAILRPDLTIYTDPFRWIDEVLK